jgi:glucose-1-phosphate thymidylyltransferase
MKAVVLAAGYATRLHPLTRNRPKALLEIAGKPVIEHTIGNIAETGKAAGIYVVTNAKFCGAFEDWLRGYTGGDRGTAGPAGTGAATADFSATRHSIRILNDGTHSNDERLGGIGDLAYVVESENIDDDLLVVGSDKLFPGGFAGIVRYFEEVGADVNACFDTKDIDRIRNAHGCVKIDGRNRIVRFQEKPPVPQSTYQSVSLYVYTAETIGLLKGYLAEGNDRDAPGHFLEWLCGRKTVYAYMLTSGCLDIGTPEALAHAARSYSARKREE